MILQMISNEHYFLNFKRSGSLYPNYYLTQKMKDAHNSLESMLLISYEYLLLNLDLLTAYRYLFQANTDSDFRIFARRIYTLMHETQSVLGRRGNVIDSLRGLLDDFIFEEYSKARKGFFKYIQKYSTSVFKVTRNNVEAHRDVDIYKQFLTSNQMKVKDSSKILLEGFDVMKMYSAQMISLLDELVKVAHGKMSFDFVKGDEMEKSNRIMDVTGEAPKE